MIYKIGELLITTKAKKIFFMIFAFIFLFVSLTLIGITLVTLISKGYINSNNDINFKYISSIGDFFAGTITPLLTMATICFLAVNYFSNEEKKEYEHKKYLEQREDSLAKEYREHDKFLDTIKLEKDKFEEDKKKFKAEQEMNEFKLSTNQWENNFHKFLESVKKNQVHQFQGKDGTIELFKSLEECKSKVTELFIPIYTSHLKNKEPDIINFIYVKTVYENSFLTYCFLLSLLRDIPDKDGRNKNLFTRMRQYIDLYLGNTHIDFASTFYLLSKDGFFEDPKMDGVVNEFISEKSLEPYRERIERMKFMILRK